MMGQDLAATFKGLGQHVLLPVLGRTIVLLTLPLLGLAIPGPAERFARLFVVGGEFKYGFKGPITLEKDLALVAKGRELFQSRDGFPKRVFLNEFPILSRLRIKRRWQPRNPIDPRCELKTDDQGECTAAGLTAYELLKENRMA